MRHKVENLFARLKGWRRRIAQATNAAHTSSTLHHPCRHYPPLAKGPDSAANLCLITFIFVIFIFIISIFAFCDLFIYRILWLLLFFL